MNKELDFLYKTIMSLSPNSHRILKSQLWIFITGAHGISSPMGKSYSSFEIKINKLYEQGLIVKYPNGDIGIPDPKHIVASRKKNGS